MNKLRFIIMVISSLLIGQCLSAERIVRLCYTNTAPFITSVSKGKATGGVSYALANEIFQRIQHVSVEIYILNWKECQQSVKNNRYDGILQMFYTFKRNKHYLYSDPTFHVNNYLYYSKSKYPFPFSWNSIDDLKTFTFEIMENNSYEEKFDQALLEKKIKAYTVKDYSIESFRRLLDGRVDFILDFPLTANININLLGHEKHYITHTEKALSTRQYHITLYKTSWATQLMPKINSAIHDIKNEGIIDRLMNYYYYIE